MHIRLWCETQEPASRWEVKRHKSQKDEVEIAKRDAGAEVLVIVMKLL